MAKKKIVKHSDMGLRIAFWAAVLFLVCFCFFTLVAGLDSGLNFISFAADGSFQLYNPLRRLEFGQVIGRDFQFFHGIGIPLLFYIPFRLLGGNLFSSELCKWLLPSGGFLLTAILFFRTTLQSWRKATIALVILLMTLLPIVSMAEPGNSLQGLRTAMPMLVAALLALDYKRLLQIGKVVLPVKQLLLILALSLSFFISTDHGVFAIFSYFLVRSYVITKHRETNGLKRPGIRLALEITAVLLLILAMFTVATMGHPLKPLIYAMKIIPAEQFWYFGGPPNAFLTWQNMSSFALHIYKAFVILGLTTYLYMRMYRQKRIRPDTHFALWFLMIYGLASCVSLLGYADIGQLGPLLKSMLSISIVLAMTMFFDYEQAYRTSRKKAPKKLRIQYAVYATATILMVVWSGRYLYRTSSTYDAIGSIKAFRYARHWPDTAIGNEGGWGRAVRSFPELQTAQQGELWSVYSNLYEDRAKIFHPSKDGFDYIIHAIGKDNFDAYVWQFVQDKPKYVDTLRPGYFVYEQWLWTGNWAFYRQLIDNYSIVRHNDSHYLWTYNGDDLNKDAVSKPLTINKDGNLELPASETELSLVEVDLKYQPETPGQLFHKLPRYLLKASDTGLRYPISLPDNKTEQTFVVPIFSKNKHPLLQPGAPGLIIGAKLKLTSATYKILQTNTNNLEPFYENERSKHPFDY